MGKFVKIKFNGNVTPYLRYVDFNYKWSQDQIRSEKGKAVSVAKMAFLDHGVPMIPFESLDEVESIIPSYLTPTEGVVFLVYEGGNFMTLVDGMEIIEKVESEFYPIDEGAAIICENDPFDKNRGYIDYVFKGMYEENSKANGMHYMFSFRNRTEEEVISAFKKTPAILFNSSHTEVDWFELLLRCYIKSKSSAVIIGKKPGSSSGNAEKRYDLCIDMANRFGIDIITINGSY